MIPGWAADANLSGSHAYSILARLQNPACVIVNNPTRFRYVGSPHLPWEALDAHRWLQPFSKSVRGSQSGVIPIPLQLFQTVFEYVDMLCLN